MEVASEFRQCVECGERIVGRSDKKFCDDRCRTAWHNKSLGHGSRFMRTVNHKLRRNRSILASLRNEGNEKVDPGDLRALGFEFDYHTYVRRARGAEIRYCYDHGFQVCNDGMVKIYDK